MPSLVAKSSVHCPAPRVMAPTVAEVGDWCSHRRSLDGSKEAGPMAKLYEDRWTTYGGDEVLGDGAGQISGGPVV